MLHANLGLEAPIPLGLFGARVCDVCDPQRCGWFEGVAARSPVLRWEYQDAPSVALLLPFDLPSCDKFFEFQRHRPMTKAIIFDPDSCLAAADEVGGCSHRRLRPSARRTMAVFRKKSCGRRSPSAGASPSMPSPTNTETMRAAGFVRV